MEERRGRAWGGGAEVTLRWGVGGGLSKGEGRERGRGAGGRGGREGGRGGGGARGGKLGVIGWRGVRGVGN